MFLSIDRDAWRFVAVVLLLAIVAGLWSRPVALGFGILAVCVAAFFRDPDRRPKATGNGLIAPADGRIIRTGPQGVSIFLSLFDVHICRSPIAGVVQSLDHIPGRFLAAWNDDASKANERVVLAVNAGSSIVRCTLVAGLVARRIVCRVEPGARIEAGERVGLIRFGSRVDVEWSDLYEPAVALGDRVRGGESLLARRAQAPAAESGKSGVSAVSDVAAEPTPPTEGYS